MGRRLIICRELWVFRLRKLQPAVAVLLTSTLQQHAVIDRDVNRRFDTVRYNYTSGLGERVTFNYFIQDKLDLQAIANFNYNDAKYTLNKDQNYKYFDQHYSIDITYTFFKRIMINNDFDYYINTGRA